MNLPKPNPFLAVLKEAYDEGRQFVYEKTGDWLEPFRMSPLLPFILSRSKTKEEILPRTYDIRNCRGARRLRSRLASLGEAESLRDKVKLSQELESLKRMLDSELGLGHVEQKVSFNIAGLMSTTLPVPEKVMRFIGKHAPRSINSRLLFLRNIFKEMAQAAGLGKYYEFLTRTPHKAGELVLTDGDLKARAQYLHAILLNTQHTERESYLITYRILKEFTKLPSKRIYDLLNQALLDSPF
jgi:hypothetical protein